MNPIKLACFVFVCSSSLAQASVPCDAFQIVVKNQLSDNLLATKIQLNGAAIEPDGIKQVDSKSSQIFTISNSKRDVPMIGEMVFHSITLPVKNVTVKFNLSNNGMICQHDDQAIDGDYSVEKTRLPNKVEYAISDK